MIKISADGQSVFIQSSNIALGIILCKIVCHETFDDFVIKTCNSLFTGWPISVLIQHILSTIRYTIIYLFMKKISSVIDGY